ncbi:MAG: hypothetical protein QXU75_08870 [Candidatus Methanomethylicaceae archaeon]
MPVARAADILAVFVPQTTPSINRRNRGLAALEVRARYPNLQVLLVFQTPNYWIWRWKQNERFSAVFQQVHSQNHWLNQLALVPEREAKTTLRATLDQLFSTVQDKQKRSSYTPTLLVSLKNAERALNLLIQKNAQQAEHKFSHSDSTQMTRMRNIHRTLHRLRERVRDTIAEAEALFYKYPQVLHDFSPLSPANDSHRSKHARHNNYRRHSGVSSTSNRENNSEKHNA